MLVQILRQRPTVILWRAAGRARNPQAKAEQELQVTMKTPQTSIAFPTAKAPNSSFLIFFWVDFFWVG